MRRLRGGFTVIELLVVLAALALLLSIATPRYMAHLDRGRDTALRHNLKALRDALDQYRADRGQPPQALQELVAARYLREVPEDPLTQRRDSWVLLTAAPADAPGAPTGIVDVRSGAAGVGQDGTPYASW